ncbi:hypothetical protein N7523_008400 [Penicillium sp. IBT 18751x]|nr:hypothetical protein N7523_008400 [Penicillium sp. IBT 18751x]
MLSKILVIRALKRTNYYLRGLLGRNPNDWVLIRNETGKKFKSKWFGPYRIKVARSERRRSKDAIDVLGSPYSPTSGSNIG